AILLLQYYFCFIAWRQTAPRRGKTIKNTIQDKENTMKILNSASLLLACLAPFAMTPALAATAATHAHAPAPQAQPVISMFGGPAYLGAPALDVTAALVQAGGGAADFSFAKALVSMLGETTVNAEVAKLNKQYGEKNVQGFIGGMDFAIKDALKRATE